MALKITEINGKLVLDGNINSVTTGFLKQHIEALKNIGSSNGNFQDANLNLWVE